MSDEPLERDPRWQKLIARGGMITLPLTAPDGWPHGPIPPGQKALEVGEDRLSRAYCSLDGHRFLRALVLLPITGGRTVFGFETWGSVSEESWQGWLAARARGEAFAGCFAWLANDLPGLDTGTDPLACNLVPGPPGQLPRLVPKPGSPLATAQQTGIGSAELAELYRAAGQDLGAVLDG